VPSGQEPGQIAVSALAVLGAEFLLIDEITYQGIYDDAASIHEHLIQNREHGLFHVIPSFVIVNAGDETLADIAKRLLVRGTAAKED
jgi:hypothetical protein